MAKRKKIVALTTDSFKNIYGYTLVFTKLFDYIQKNNRNLDVTLVSNDGICARMVNNNNFIKVKLNNKSGQLYKTISLVFAFIKNTRHYDKNAVLVSNAEIPELLSTFLLKRRFGKVYCLIHDFYVRDKSLKIKLINRFRLFLIHRIKNVIFINKHTMNQLDNSINKFYIGNPVF